MATKLQKPQIVEDDETYSEAEGLHLWKVFLQVLGFILVILIVPIVGYFISKSYVFERMCAMSLLLSLSLTYCFLCAYTLQQFLHRNCISTNRSHDRYRLFRFSTIISILFVFCR